MDHIDNRRIKRLLSELHELRNRIHHSGAPERDIIERFHRIRYLIRDTDHISDLEAKELREQIHHIRHSSNISGELGYELERIIDDLNSKAGSYTLPEIDVNQDSNIVFLLGAGASKASGIPTVNELLDNLLVQARRAQMDGLQPLIAYCEQHDDIDIEDLLTATYLSDFAVSERHVTRLLNYFLFSGDDEISDATPSSDASSVNYIQNTLQTLFGLLTETMIPKKPNETHVAIREFVESHDNISIVTTNYDYCMDQELLNNEIGLAHTIDRSDEDKFEESVDLIKMHGSINWWYCESCQNIINALPSTVQRASSDGNMDYPVIGLCPHCGGQRRPLLVPPISFKFVMFPPLIEMWNEGKERIENADHIIAVGYSFSDSDAYIYKLISKSLTESDETTLTIVNPEPDVAIKLRERFRTELGESDPEERIKDIPGKSQEVVPELVQQMLDAQTSTITGDETEEGEAATDD